MASGETAANEAVPQTQPASLIGQVLDGRYRILRRIGEGDTGEVYAAENVVIGKPLAIKLLHRDTVSDPGAVTRFFQRARSAGSIHHRNIVEIVDFGQLADGRIYLCMELLAGAALRELTAQPMAVDRLLNILLQAGQGLAAAHARGIVHRDLKPETIFVTIGPNGEDVPKLLDVGIADASSTDDRSRTRTGVIFGTPVYWAPEQARGQPVDARTDIYALGVILYESFSGTPPFQDESPGVVLSQHLTVEPEPVAQRAATAGRHLPPGLAEIITRCLQKDPAQRFQTMDELVAALGQVRRDVAGPGWDLPMTASRGLPGSAERAIAAPGSAGAYPGSVAPGGPGAPLAAPGLPPPDSRALSDSRESAASPAPPPLALDENVQFTVYRPRAIAPVRWYSLLAFAHLAERRPGELDAPDPIDEVHRQAEAVLGEHAAAYQSTTQDSGAAIPAEGELVLVVDIPGMEVNPPRRSFLWTEPVHREEFRIRAGSQIVGTTARGRLTVFLGCIVIAELPLAVRVEAAPATTAVDHTQVRTYRRIFASYSHRDGAIVQQFERYARALGDEYLRDAVHLRSGEVWNDRLLQMIEQADAFQLFWSHNSMHSIYVRQEYEHALSLNRPSFVRPTYWEDPMPTAEGLPPEALRRLHFQKLGGIVEPPQQKGLESSAQPPVTSPATGSVPDVPMMPPPDVEPPPREPTDAHEILAPDEEERRAEAERRATPPRPHPPDRHIPLERGDPARRAVSGQSQPRPPVVAPPDGRVDEERQPPSRWPAVRALSVLALAVLALLVLGVLLRWIF